MKEKLDVNALEKEEKMRGLVLEGGGARGAYEIGAIKAFLENGYVFDGAVGTSIGSINAAMVVQNDFERAVRLWEEITPGSLFPDEAKLIGLIGDKDIEPHELQGAIKNLGEIIKQGGIDTGSIRKLLEGCVDEEKIRGSSMDFGLVTYSVSDGKRLSLFKEEMPQGTLVDYLLASSMLPVFKKEKIGGKLFADGGYVDVCPYNMLLEKGYSDLVIIRVFGTGITRRIKSKDAKIQMVIPSEKLGSMLDFSPENIKRLMKMGYYDAMRGICGYKGRKYFVKPMTEEYYFNKLINIDEKYLTAIGNILSLPVLPGKRLLFDGIIPVLADSLKLYESFTYEDFIIAVLESAALSKGIERYQILSFEDLLQRIKENVYKNPDKKYTEINLPYKNPMEDNRIYRLPVLPIASSYSYKAVNEKQIGNATELFIKAIST